MQGRFQACTEFRLDFVQHQFRTAVKIRYDFVQGRGKAGKSSLLSRKRTNTRRIIEHIFEKWRINRLCTKSCRILCTIGSRNRRKTHVSFPQADPADARNDVGISCTKRGRKLCTKRSRNALHEFALDARYGAKPGFAARNHVGTFAHYHV